MFRKKLNEVICLDFDGVIHPFTTPFKDWGIIPDPPVEGALEWMFDAIQTVDISVLSVRSNYFTGRAGMRSWLKRHAEEMDLWDPPSKAHRGLKHVEFPTSKPAACIYIDDRGFRFEGKFPPLRQLLALKTWEQRR